MDAQRQMPILSHVLAIELKVCKCPKGTEAMHEQIALVSIARHEFYCDWSGIIYLNSTEYICTGYSKRILTDHT